MQIALALSSYLRAQGNALAARAFLDQAARRCDAMRASPTVTTETIVRHHPTVALEVQVWRAGVLLGTIREDADTRGWWVAQDSHGFEEPLASRVAAMEWLVGRAEVRA